MTRTAAQPAGTHTHTHSHTPARRRTERTPGTQRLGHCWGPNQIRTGSRLWYSFGITLTSDPTCHREAMRCIVVMPLLVCLWLVDGSQSSSSLGELHTEFAVNLYHSLMETDNNSNLVVSPANIWLGLGLLQLAARGNTLSQLQGLLGYDANNAQLQDLFQSQSDMGNSSQGVKVEMSSTLLVQEGLQLHPEFIQRALKWGNTGPLSVNSTNHSSESAEPWPELGRGLTDSGLVFLSLLGFRGVWQKQFLHSDTHTLPFSLPHGTHTKVPMMYQATDVNFGQFQLNSEQTYSVLEMPYHSHSVSLTLVLPNDRKTPLSMLESHLSSHTIALWEGGLRRTKMDVFLPRFRLQQKFDLKALLMSLGILDAFDPTAADFRGISEQGLYVTQALHQARIEVTEEGSKGTAAAAMVLLKRSRSPLFKADRPFIFLLRQLRTGLILFMGRMVNPVAQPV
ncbi:putative serpin E3 [Denticeps clupeoides]|uniref:putative serpin E3 n=1 Tax=Denticeps clupeoides TaxID=299321 RepID=UPI0010A5407C|nr:serpin E3 [Denticeps clupeoides]